MQQNSFGSPNTMEIQLKERELLAKGYRLVEKSLGADPGPGEYTKTSHTGSSTSFEGLVKITLTWME